MLVVNIKSVVGTKFVIIPISSYFPKPFLDKLNHFKLIKGLNKEEGLIEGIINSWRLVLVVKIKNVVETKLVIIPISFYFPKPFLDKLIHFKLIQGLNK